MSAHSFKGCSFTGDANKKTEGTIISWLIKFELGIKARLQECQGGADEQQFCAMDLLQVPARTNP